ncbi:hypothetical protein D3C76_875170 [compost metagenome]
MGRGPHEQVVHVVIRTADLAHAACIGTVDVHQRRVELERRHRHPVLAIGIGRGDQLDLAVVAQHIGAQAHRRRNERHIHRRRAQTEQQHAFVDLHHFQRRFLARLAEVRFQRNKVQGNEGEHQFPDLAGRAEHADIGTAVGNHGQVLEVRAQNLAHQRHRLAPRAPATDTDGHAVTQLADDLGGGHLLVHRHVPHWRPTLKSWPQWLTTVLSNGVWRSQSTTRPSQPYSRSNPDGVLI